ncbi:MAG: AAA family ATPase [Chloroflexi bacterium]|nr:AAA family ATPase [Chloroflexota bacterium]
MPTNATRYRLLGLDAECSYPGWWVDTDIALGTFSFSKLAMYEDLTRMREQGVRSELTRMLAGGPGEGGARAGGSAPATPRDSELTGGQLDDLLDIRDQYTVLPADFSQLRAIDEARRGGNLLIHGPPGTGKSQTISNLIRTLIADGKRVLFVSEKTAALDVVKRRLDECGLGPFCLDLHSDRGRKSQVYAQLRSSMADARDGIAQAVSVDELIEHRDHLNRVVRALHEVREPLGLSVYEVQGHFAQLRDLPRFEQFDVPGTADLTGQWTRGAQDAALRPGSAPGRVSGAHDEPVKAPSDAATVRAACRANSRGYGHRPRRRGHVA